MVENDSGRLEAVAVSHELVGIFANRTSKFEPFGIDEVPEELFDDAKTTIYAHRAYLLFTNALTDAVDQSHELTDEAMDFVMSIHAQRQTLLNSMEVDKRALTAHTEKEQAIIKRYMNADDEAKKVNASMDKRVKLRLAQYNEGIDIASDVDKTITLKAEFLRLFPGSAIAENHMDHPENGRAVFPLMHVLFWRPALKIVPHIFRKVGKRAELRPGAIEFFQKIKDHRIPTQLVSANFKLYVDEIANQLPEGSIEEIRAVEADDIASTDKSTVVRNRALKYPNRALIYIGDGESDYPAMDKDARRVVACYFALEGSDFAKALELEGLPYYTYKDFNDITFILERLGIFEGQVDCNGVIYTNPPAEAAH